MVSACWRARDARFPLFIILPDVDIVSKFSSNIVQRRGRYQLWRGCFRRVLLRWWPILIYPATFLRLLSLISGNRAKGQKERPNFIKRHSSRLLSARAWFQVPCILRKSGIATTRLQISYDTCRTSHHIHVKGTITSPRHTSHGIRHAEVYSLLVYCGLFLGSCCTKASSWLGDTIPPQY